MNVTDKIQELDKRCAGIYIIRNKINNLIYIGGSSQLKYRIRKHTEALNRGNHQNKKLQIFCNKYGIDSIYFELLEIVKDREDLIIKEQYWLDKLKPFNSNGFNILTIATTNLGYKIIREKNIKSIEDKKISKERHREVMRNFMKGKKYALGHKMSQEQKDSISKRMIGHKYNLGRKQSEEHKRKLSELNKGHKRNKRKTILVYKDGILIDEVYGVLELSNKYNINSGNISQVCKGIRKTIGGLTLKYKE